MTKAKGYSYQGLQFQRDDSPSPPWQGAWQQRGRNGKEQQLRAHILTHKQEAESTLVMVGSF